MEETRSARKRRAILDAARAVFLRNGYQGTSMDEVAALAEVSKQTVYKHFADKERLFTEIITNDIREGGQRSDVVLDQLPDSADLEHDLREIARRLVTAVTQPHLIRMRRVVIGEADRFPDLARTWYSSGPERGYERLAHRFAQLTDQGRLNTPDPLPAAQQFVWLALSVPLNKAMFDPEPYPVDELHRFADEGVRTFLAAYRG
ncbi:AcrR family transcriptional regulator [Saccharothrix tamanrassetensis]|uniref:AcrR family transcriptional regulator n=1 Tax=Saccharothrix tamanrassetensis TaxID=1051531 RepID=A0A841CEA5_9PSEU|nr:TetR/AcrR family transcriptional regulator [Saccharothrix tamanrassetensis]MBB5956882.1 AcrR family transcriptional regulator [Saccharothrix tamanrassetensis]